MIRNLIFVTVLGSMVCAFCLPVNAQSSDNSLETQIVELKRKIEELEARVLVLEGLHQQKPPKGIVETDQFNLLQPQSNNPLLQGLPSLSGNAKPSPSTVLPQAGTSNAISADLEFDLAFGFSRREEYRAAVEKFREFIAKYPDDAKSAQAYFWLGDAYFKLGYYRDAAQVFVDGYKAHSKSEVAAKTLLFLGISMRELNKKDAACATFKELESKFPDLEVDVADQLREELERTEC